MSIDSFMINNFRNPSPCREGESENTPCKEQEVSFSIKRALGSRKGWKIMPDDGHIIDGSALKTVVSMIKNLEFQVLVLEWSTR